LYRHIETHVHEVVEGRRRASVRAALIVLGLLPDDAPESARTLAAQIKSGLVARGWDADLVTILANESGPVTRERILGELRGLSGSPHEEFWLVLLGQCDGAEVTTIAAPTLNFVPGRGLRFAITFDDAAPQTVTLAVADAFRKQSLGLVDYYELKNVQADTQMRTAIAGNGPSK